MSVVGSGDCKIWLMCLKRLLLRNMFLIHVGKTIQCSSSNFCRYLISGWSKFPCILCTLRSHGVDTDYLFGLLNELLSWSHTERLMWSVCRLTCTAHCMTWVIKKYVFIMLAVSLNVSLSIQGCCYYGYIEPYCICNMCLFL
jgi:hypothetical protein